MIRLLNEEEEISPKEQLDKILKSICRILLKQFPIKAKEVLPEYDPEYLEDSRGVSLKNIREFDKTEIHSAAGYEVCYLDYLSWDERKEVIEKILQKVFPKAQKRNNYCLELPSQRLVGCDKEAYPEVTFSAGLIHIDVSADKFKAGLVRASRKPL